MLHPQVLGALLGLLAQSLPFAHANPFPSHYPPLASPVKSNRYTNKLGAVACENEICSTIGVNILRSGGNAADAMVASVLCVGTVGMYEDSPRHYHIAAVETNNLLS
jgi:gamma-glutamyltranspeptidase/glutathione hydrolase